MDNKAIVIQLKNGSTILLETLFNIEISNVLKIFSVQSKKIFIEKEFPVSFEIFFKLKTFGGNVTIKKGENTRIRIYRQQLTPITGGNNRRR